MAYLPGIILKRKNFHLIRESVYYISHDHDIVKYMEVLMSYFDFIQGTSVVYINKTLPANTTTNIFIKKTDELCQFG